MMMNRRDLFVGAAAAGLAVAAQQRAFAAGELKATFHKFVSIVVYHTAKDQGFFKSEGIVLNDTFAPPTMNIQALVAGQFDVAFNSVQDIAQIQSKGSDVRIIYPGVILGGGTPYARLVVPIDSPIKTAKDLEGKRIALPFLKSIIDVDIFAWLNANGVDHTKVTLVPVGVDGIVSAVRSKQFDAVYSIEPSFALIMQEKTGRYLAAPGDVYGPEGYMSTGFIARESWVKSNKGLAQATVRALDKATEWLIQNPTKMPAIVSGYTGIDPAVTAKMMMPGLIRRVKMAHLQPLLMAAAKYNYLPATNACDMLSEVCPKEC